jgi:hypothetical protein
LTFFGFFPTASSRTSLSDPDFFFAPISDESSRVRLSGRSSEWSAGRRKSLDPGSGLAAPGWPSCNPGSLAAPSTRANSSISAVR